MVDGRRFGWFGAFLVVGGALLAQDAHAQAPPRMPSREEIAERVRQVLQAAPSTTIELPGVCKITYKQVPTDPRRIAQTLGQQMGGGVPAGVDIDQYVKMYEPQVTELLNEALQDVGKLEALVELKLKSKRIPPGEYKLSIICEGERPAALIISGDDLPNKRPVDIRFKTRGVELQPELKLEFKTPKDMEEGKEKFDLLITFMRTEALSKTKLERTVSGS